MESRRSGARRRAAAPRPSRRPHLTAFPLAEDVAVTVLSGIVLLVLALGVFLPAGSEIVVRTATAKPADNPQFIVCYGSLVDESGQPVSGAAVEVRDSSGAVVQSGTTAADGTFRFRWKDGADTYTVTLTANVGGVPVTGSTTLAMAPGSSYGIDATLVQSTTIIFVPIPTY
ncbi:MAG: hypothetical protein C0418_00610 [Coriobacteriaceae bacterium]|nr:hypothetical protein [Coriobacteriaceae bacterium]